MNHSKAKISIGILFGGKSVEHEVSLISAKNIIENIDKSKYDVKLIGIDNEGRWYLDESSRFLLSGNERFKAISSKNDDINSISSTNNSLALVLDEKQNNLISITDNKRIGKIDVIFPVLHGTYGEDGSIQGLLKLANLPYVGCGIAASAVSMDKTIMKQLFKASKLPTANYLEYTYSKKNLIKFDYISNKLKLPFIVKPANLGSSVGVHKISSGEDFTSSIEDAFKYDNKIMFEEFIDGIELECAVLGNNDKPLASSVGEVIPDDKYEFYTYEAKYLDEKGAALIIPANIDKKTTKKIQKLALKVYTVLNCDGMARVDFFLKKNGTVLINEINTIPGFTNISMYPKLWEHSGIPYSKLIDALVQLALEKFKSDKRVTTKY